jgi:hypothetical protein
MPLQKERGGKQENDGKYGSHYESVLLYFTVLFVKLWDQGGEEEKRGRGAGARSCKVGPGNVSIYFPGHQESNLELRSLQADTSSPSKAAGRESGTVLMLICFHNSPE